RRLRRHERLRSLVRETSLVASDLVYPLFVREGRGARNEISSMPGQYHFSVDTLVEEAGRAEAAGIAGVILFGLPGRKDAEGSGAWDDEGVVQAAVRSLKKTCPDLAVITDLCLCEYTDHGHCGALDGETVDNDRTLDLLARAAVSQARAGADMIAPSDMMDGRIGAIRGRLDEAGFKQVAILSYAAKYASVFYGPFREAAGSAPAFGDRRSYQMDPGNSDEALREVGLDIEEGADIVMVKPALPYLDVVRRVKDRFGVPVAAYQVSGEYSMIVAASGRGMIDRDRAILETLVSIRRAGADFILTYFAPEAARLLARG
ncbi:MAG: porphobilinogen synthase, partial [Thermoplasmata archaeon]